jgi:hypothetical protein
MGMISRILAALAATLALGACNGPPPPAQVDAFTSLYNRSPSSAVPVDAPVTMGQPVAFITTDNVEHHIGYNRDAWAYWNSMVPASLENTVAMADTDPTYFSAKLIEMLRRHWPSIQNMHDLREAKAAGMQGAIVVDLRWKYFEPYGDRTYKIDIDLYFFDASMTPMSKMNGHGEYTLPMITTDGRVQKTTDAALAQVDAKITALVH